MSNIKSLLTKYKEVLLAKSLQDLNAQLGRLGRAKQHRKKSAIIAQILALTQSSEKNLARAAKVLQMLNCNPKNQTIHLLQMSQNKFQVDQIKPLHLNRQLLHSIVSSQQVVTENYCKRFGNSRLLTSLFNQLTQTQQKQQQICQIEKDIKNIQQQMQLKTLSIQANISQGQQVQQEQGEVEDEEEKKKGRKNWKVYKPKQAIKLINDVQIADELQKKMAYQFKQILSQLNVQTEIIYQDKKISNVYELDQEQLKIQLQNEQAVSFQKKVGNLLGKSLRKLKKGSQHLAYRVRTISEARSVLQLIKQNQYNSKIALNCFKALMRKEDFNQSKNELTNFMQNFWRNTEFYIKMLQEEGSRAQITLINNLLNMIDKQLIEEEGQKIVVYNQNLILFGLRVAIQFKQSNQSNQSSEILNICEKLIAYWISINKSLKVYSVEDLGLFMKGLYLIDQILILLTQKYEYNPLKIYESPEYGNISKQAIQGMQNIFDGQSASMLSIQNINELITNFQSVYGAEEISEKIIVNCIQNSYKWANKINIRTRKALIRMIGGRNLRAHVTSLMIQWIICFSMGLDTRETLLAIQLAITYEINDREKVIQDLILHNVNPVNLKQEVKTHLIKVANQQISSERIRKEIIWYLNQKL